MGILLSLGSTSVVNNMFSGLMLTYMRSFVPVDFIEVSGVRGTVIARHTFSTRLRTAMNEEINIPNSVVSANHIINYSHPDLKKGVKIGTSITIGYDVPWRKIHYLMKKSTEGVPYLDRDEEPVVFQVELEDFYVKYRLVVSTDTPEKEYVIRTKLHQNIQDEFALAGVEIMSPHYRNNRDGTPTTIPQITREAVDKGDQHT